MAAFLDIEMVAADAGLPLAGIAWGQFAHRLWYDLLNDILVVVEQCASGGDVRRGRREARREGAGQFRRQPRPTLSGTGN